MRKITDSMSLISQFDLINKNIFLLILQCININYSLCMTDTIYQFTARNVYKTIFNLKDLIDKKNNKLDQFNDTYSRG